VPNATRASDPWVAFGPDGRAYLSAIAWQPSPANGPDLVSALVVVASADGGLTWQQPVAAAVAPSSDISHDNLAITADPTRPRVVYAVTTRAESRQDGSYFGRLGFTRSSDGGKTWTPLRPVTGAVNGERIGAPQILVDARTGRLFAVYHRSLNRQGVIGVMTSDDRGDSWSKESVAATARGEIGVSYFSSRFSRNDSMVRVMLRRFTLAAGLTPTSVSTLDTFALEWSGDYHGLAAARDRFIAAYGRANDIGVAWR
jgi:hypothetical protein